MSWTCTNTRLTLIDPESATSSMSGFGSRCKTKCFACVPVGVLMKQCRLFCGISISFAFINHASTVLGRRCNKKSWNLNASCTNLKKRFCDSQNDATALNPFLHRPTFAKKSTAKHPMDADSMPQEDIGRGLFICPWLFIHEFVPVHYSIVSCSVRSRYM